MARASPDLGARLPAPPATAESSNAPEGREASLLRYWLILRKRRETVLLFTGIVVLVVTLYTLLAPKVYEGRAVLEITPESTSAINVEEVTDALTVTTAEERRMFYNTQYRIMQSERVLQSALDALEDQGNQFVYEIDKDRRIDTLRRLLTIDPELDTRLVNVVVRHTDPEDAALFANTIAQAYIDANRARSLQAAEGALSWLRERQQKARSEKEASNQKVHAYKYPEEGLLGLEEQSAAVRMSLERLQAAWSEAHARRVEVESGYLKARSLLGSGAWVGLARLLAAEDPVLQNLIQSWQDLEKEQSALASRYLPDHPSMGEIGRQLVEVEAQIKDQADQILAGQRARLDLLVTQEKALAFELEQVKSELGDLDRRFLNLNDMKDEAEQNTAFYKTLDQRAAEVALLSDAGLQQFIESNNIWMVDAAKPTGRIVRPLLRVNLPWSLIVGLLGGIALAFFMEYVDNTVKSREDVEEIVGVPFLGAVPVLPPQELTALQDERDQTIFVNARPRSPVAEALRSIRTNILFHLEGDAMGAQGASEATGAAGRRRHRRLLVTSAAPREGKSFVTSNLAAIIAMTGSRVLLVDADLRRPTQHKLFRLPNDRGLSTALQGEAPLNECIQETHVRDLHLMAAGSRPPNPAEILSSERMVQLLDDLKEYDVVLVDSSPVTAVADPLILSRLVHGVVLVIESNHTARELVLQSRARLAEMGAEILGAIVNKLDVRKAGYGYYYYYDYHTVYYYGEGDGRSGRRKA
ncbi:MAG: polysaccharide biosynthesis tyrosine autokinase [Deltaproteobacteria bacterium]|nr:polysaccharide biosynthesis tyrosine autokinase [Deltaproteobacteria bacterium]